MSTVRLLRAASALVMMAVPHALQAQRCAGAPILVAESFRLSGGAMTGPGTSGQGAQAATGVVVHGRQVHAQATLTRITRRDAFDAPARTGRVDPAYGVDGELGWEALRGAGGRLALCPLVAVGLVSGPEVTSGTGGEELETEALVHTGAVGAWLGVALRDASAVEIVPAIGVRVAHDRGEVTNDGTAGGVRIDEADPVRDTWGLVSLAVGATLGGRFTLRPQLDLPVGHQGDDLLLRLLAGFLVGP